MKPLILIGAPRSGTNLLRDLLCRLPGLGTWPCDEINPIWRHGNTSYPSDELGPDHARAAVRRFVRRAFDKLALRRHLEQVVEKTCANSLRVPFVREILPDARFVFLVRDGRDATASAIRRWSAPFELSYTLRKARYVPTSDAPRYLALFLSNRLRKLAFRDRRLLTWGPRFCGLDALVREQGVAAACALQWVRCVDSAARNLADLGPDRLAVLRYEELVARPAETLRRLASFVGHELDLPTAQEMTRHVTPGKVGSWESLLTPEDREVVEAMLATHLDRLLAPCHSSTVGAAES